MCALIAETQKLLAEGGCKCHKVMSNSKEVLESVDIEDTVQIKDSNLHKPLGIFWNVESDQLHFPLDFDHCKMTRRGLLSNLAKFYDPIGVISPLIHQAKLLLHQGWGAVSYSSLSITQLKIYSTRYLNFLIILHDKST